jgi:hypothetical protein
MENEMRRLHTLWSATEAQSDPTDSDVPPADTAAQGPSLRTGGRAADIELELAGTGSATVYVYVWDADTGQWSRLIDEISITGVAGGGPTARRTWRSPELGIYQAIWPVCASITGGTLTCRGGVVS